MTKERIKFEEYTIWKLEMDTDNFYYRFVGPESVDKAISLGYEVVPIETQAKQGATSANKTG